MDNCTHAHTCAHTHTCMVRASGEDPNQGYTTVWTIFALGRPQCGLSEAHHSVDGLWHTIMWTVLV